MVLFCKWFLTILTIDFAAVVIKHKSLWDNKFQNVNSFNQIK